jgi:hypothetical protein
MMLGLTREDWAIIADLVRKDGDKILLQKIGEDGKKGFDASMRLYNASRESLHWWEDSYSTIGCDEQYVLQKIKEKYDEDTARIVKMLRVAVQSAQ